MNPSLSSITVVPPIEPKQIHSACSTRRKSSFSGEFEYRDTLSDLQEKIVFIKQNIKNVNPSNLNFAKQTLIHEQQQKRHFEEKLDQMRETDNQLSLDPTKSDLTKEFQIQLRTIMLSTEEHLRTYDTLLSDLDRNIKRNLSARDEKEHPPILRQTAHHALQPMSTWQKICAYFKSICS